jgi:hypothetical protein
LIDTSGDPLREPRDEMRSLERKRALQLRKTHEPRTTELKFASHGMDWKRTSAQGTLKLLEYEYRVKTAALGTLKRYSILSLTLYL